MMNIQNPGLIDLDFMKIMGVNVKDNDNAIGHFGTGLKYAIAVFLREDIPFRLFVGTNEYVFYKETKTLRDKQFEICCMQGPHDFVELPFTTELGKNWSPWMAYREIMSNALDEGGSLMPTGPKDGHTTFQIEEREEFEDTFLTMPGDALVFKNDEIEIYEGECNYIYNQGIRAYDCRVETKYTYNLVQGVALTEDRTIAYDWSIKEIVGKAMARIDDEDVLQSLMDVEGYWEEDLDMHSHVIIEPSDTFKAYASAGERRPYWVDCYLKKWQPPEEEPEMTNQEKAERIWGDLRELCEELDVYTTIRENGDLLTFSVDLNEEYCEDD